MTPQLLLSICHQVITGIFQNKNLDLQRLYLFLCRNQRKNFKCSRQCMHCLPSLIPLELTLAIQLDKAQTVFTWNSQSEHMLHPYSKSELISALQHSNFIIWQRKVQVNKAEVHSQQWSASESTHKALQYVCLWKQNRSIWGKLFLRGYFHIISLHG